MKRTSSCVALVFTLAVLGCRSEGNREQAMNESPAAAPPTKVFSCKLGVNICTEHRGADSWSNVVKSGCTDSGASWLEAACPTENVFGTCTRKYDERTTVTHLYRGKIITDAVAEHLCKDGVWEPAPGGTASAGAASEVGSDAPSAAKVTTHPVGPAPLPPTGPEAKAAAPRPRPQAPKPPPGPARPPVGDEAF